MTKRSNSNDKNDTNDQNINDYLAKLSNDELDKIELKIKEYLIHKEEKRIAWEQRKLERNIKKSKLTISNDQNNNLDKINTLYKEALKSDLDISSLLKDALKIIK